ncbi:MAG: helix-turn-helix domain-containing protein [Clostridia bacterium]|nr:helix-turn-helix domain-containing protein [Clostridia bacterium]NCD03753.1 helix-turn-helix domain-containing protein [Clostridia bacterium]
MNLGAALKQLRRELNITQTEFGAALDLNLTTVSRWERGKTVPTRSTALNILGYARRRGTTTACQEALKEALFPTVRRDGLDDLKYTQMNRINEMLNDSSNAVIISDSDTYELLYANKQAERISTNPLAKAVGKKCYEYCMSQDSPCHFCFAEEISTDKYTERYFTSERTGKHYLIRGKQIIWDGRRAYLEYITDVTEMYKMQEQMIQNHKMMKIACRSAQMWVFTIDVKKNVAYLDDIIQDTFHLPSTVCNFWDEIFTWDMFLPEYFPVIKEMIEKIKSGEKHVETEAQIHYFDNRIHWTRYRSDTIAYDRYGKPKTAICSAQLIDREKALVNRIRFEHEQILNREENILGFVISNLSRNRITEHQGMTGLAKILQNGMNYEETVGEAAGLILNKEIQMQFLEFHERENLLKRYSKGELAQTMEYPFRLITGEVICLQDEMRLAMNPANGDIMLYEYCFEVKN